MIEDYLKQWTNYYQKAGKDLTGKPAFATPVEIRCREQYKRQNVRGPSGQTAVSDIQLFLLASQSLAVGDEFTTEEGERLKVIALGKPRGLDSIAFKIAYLGG